MQEALASACAKWSRVSRTRDPDAYVRRMIVNAHVSGWRRTRRESPVGEVREAAYADPAAVADTADAVWRVCEGLPRQQRAAVVLRFYEDLEYAEIAAILEAGRADRALARPPGPRRAEGGADGPGGARDERSRGRPAAGRGVPSRAAAAGGRAWTRARPVVHAARTAARRRQRRRLPGRRPRSAWPRQRWSRRSSSSSRHRRRRTGTCDQRRRPAERAAADRVAHRGLARTPGRGARRLGLGSRARIDVRRRHDPVRWARRPAAATSAVLSPARTSAA